MSVFPPGATNSKVPPCATASSPVEQPASATIAALASAASLFTSLPGQLRVSPADVGIAVEIEGGQRGQITHPPCRKMMQSLTRHRPAQRFHGPLMTDAHRLMTRSLDPGPVQRSRHSRRDLRIRLTP